MRIKKQGGNERGPMGMGENCWKPTASTNRRIKRIGSLNFVVFLIFALENRICDVRLPKYLQQYCLKNNNIAIQNIIY
jgi:hypothetical protein